ncbi:HNH endonuclease [Lacticaseibacillus yichunensis]|uniref:Putative HNH nuclease YajD n=1 Tax=Lacticaseibacillus yichunensis TaxID=2486015 RepID=A0ABW4CL14_9LACO|nr:HNH endonuclease [Lacticaseibacillus yichunensis]
MPMQKLSFINGKPTLVPVNQRTRQSSDRQYNQRRADADSDYLSFYHSAAWLHTRKQVLMRDNYLCQRCGLEATLVDHVIPSEDDWEDRLNVDNLEALCKDCHYWKTRRENAKRKKGERRAMRINVIAGYPASGKTTYVRDHCGSHDLIYDYDALMAALTGQPAHTHNINAHDYVQLIYEMMLRKLKAEQTFDNVWIILTYPDDKLDSLLVNRDVHHIRLTTSREICVARLREQGRLDAMEAINKVDQLLADGKFAGYSAGGDTPLGFVGG